MKKTTKTKTPSKKLQLRKERVRELNQEALDSVGGAGDPGTGACATTALDQNQV